MSEQPIGFAAGRRYTVIPTLGDLRGPATGAVVLPKRLDWGPPRVFDLADRADVAVMYETVLRESHNEADLAAFLDARLLLTVWPRLVLPPPLRAAWQTRFPQLRQAAAA
ncbi:MAG TPA: hypothetical protein VLH10_05010 [Yinghuangia sp.]|nr:hypothetical protein [Yinghuangia sp.]